MSSLSLRSKGNWMTMRVNLAIGLFTPSGADLLVDCAIKRMQKICHAIPTSIVLNIYVVFIAVRDNSGTNFATCAHLQFVVRSLTTVEARSQQVLGYGPIHWLHKRARFRRSNINREGPTRTGRGKLSRAVRISRSADVSLAMTQMAPCLSVRQRRTPSFS